MLHAGSSIFVLRFHVDWDQFFLGVGGVRFPPSHKPLSFFISLFSVLFSFPYSLFSFSHRTMRCQRTHTSRWLFLAGSFDLVVDRGLRRLSAGLLCRRRSHRSRRFPAHSKVFFAAGWTRNPI